MITKIYTFFILVLIMGTFIACNAINDGLVEIDAADAGKTINLKVGDTLTVALEGNITTGFNWVPAPMNPELLKQAGDVEVTPESDLVGAAGTIVLKFEAAAKGTTTLHLDYRQPWDNETPAEKTFEVTVVVK